MNYQLYEYYRAVEDTRVVTHESGEKFVDCETGDVYLEEDGYRILSDTFDVVIRNVDHPLDTGMLHLVEGGNERRAKFLGCVVNVRRAHYFGDADVFYSEDIHDYFTSDEVEILSGRGD